MSRPPRTSVPHPLRSPRSAVLIVGLGGMALPAGAAEDAGLQLSWLYPQHAVGFAVVMGIVIFATTLAILHLVERRRWAEQHAALSAQNVELRRLADRTDILLGAERQVVAVWSGPDAEPAIDGDPTVAGAGVGLPRVLAFRTWLAPADAGRLDSAVDRLRERGEPFRTTLRRSRDGFVEAEGRTSGGRALLRLRDVSRERAALLAAEGGQQRAAEELADLQGLLDAAPEPFWLRGRDGVLSWANQAYCGAVQAKGPEAVRERRLELLDAGDRDEAARQRAAGATFRARVAAVVAGSRRILDIVEVPLGEAAGGMARDVSEVETLRADLNRLGQAQARMLDQLPTAVATFDAKQQLLFHNAAYRQLWGLDGPFLATRPTDGEILDRLRRDRKLPEQADYRTWKAGLLDAYRGPEPGEDWWHLPDGRTLRVVTHPAPQGGLTYLFDDVSDRMNLESSFNALALTQRETLDALAEGVALFGTDGRLKLFNRAFAELWRLDPASLDGQHVEAVFDQCRPLSPEEAPWSDLGGAVSGLSERRERTAVRLERRDGAVIDGAAEPLPGGTTLLTFVDVTATVDVERVLTERNDALELAGRLRNDFVHHVSFELREPLTSIIGFAQILRDETFGPLNERQREYAGYITRSSGVLLAIINDILDLASIDADTIELARKPVDLRATVEAAAAGVEARIIEADLRLVVDIPPGLDTFLGDAKRVRQIIYNLLSNAAGFSLSGQTITVAAHDRGDAVAVSVSDRGHGIASDLRDRVFDRFESRTAGTRHRGVGLGLSIVRAFVELHGGRVELVSQRGEGTTVTCLFPKDGVALRASAPPAMRPPEGDVA